MVTDDETNVRMPDNTHDLVSDIENDDSSLMVGISNFIDSDATVVPRH